MSDDNPYLSPATSTPQPAAGGLGGYLDGSQPLWKAFWLFYFLGFNLLWLALAFGLPTALFMDIVIALKRATGLGSATIIRALYTPPTFAFALLSLVVVWRCAVNTGLRLWTWLARLVVSLYALWVASKLPPLFL